jgi:hypothetical protein
VTSQAARGASTGRLVRAPRSERQTPRGKTIGVNTGLIQNRQPDLHTILIGAI